MPVEKLEQTTYQTQFTRLVVWELDPCHMVWRCMPGQLCGAYRYDILAPKLGGKAQNNLDQNKLIYLLNKFNSGTKLQKLILAKEYLALQQTKQNLPIRLTP